MKHESWPFNRSKMEPGGYLPLEWPMSFGFTPECSTWNKSSFQKLKYGTGSSPGCSSVLEKSIERRSNLGGVPVLRRPNSKPISFSDPDKLIAADSPDRP